MIFSGVLVAAAQFSLAVVLSVSPGDGGDAPVPERVEPLCPIAHALEALDVPAVSSDAMVHYEFGAMPSANQGFLDEFPNGVLPRDTSLFLRCR